MSQSVVVFHSNTPIKSLRLFVENVCYSEVLLKVPFFVQGIRFSQNQHTHILKSIKQRLYAKNSNWKYFPYRGTGVFHLFLTPIDHTRETSFGLHDRLFTVFCYLKVS